MRKIPLGRSKNFALVDDIDYARLADWCRALPGTVDVCENVGADWLPFQLVLQILAI